MAYRASPPRKVTAFSKAAVADAEAAPTVVGDFTNLEQSTITHEDGFATPVFAILPDKHHYDRLRFSFGPVTLGNADNEATLAVWAYQSDGSISLVGTSVLSADNVFPAVESENYQALYAVTVQTLTGTTSAVTVDTMVQGVHQGYVQ